MATTAEEWADFFESAVAGGRHGDLLVLAEEAPTAAHAQRARLAARIEHRETDRRAFLFSGHMVDAPDRPQPRFPRHAEAAAAAAIAGALDDLEARSGDIAFCSAACGGDLIFAEHCLRRGLLLDLVLPSPEEDFLPGSVAFAGDDWVDRFHAVSRNPAATISVMTDAIGPGGQGENEYARTNRLLVARWRVSGAVRSFLALWDAETPDSGGGTAHMIEIAAPHADSSRIIRIDEIAQEEGTR